MFNVFSHVCICGEKKAFACNIFGEKINEDTLVGTRWKE